MVSLMFVNSASSGVTHYHVDLDKHSYHLNETAIITIYVDIPLSGTITVDTGETIRFHFSFDPEVDYSGKSANYSYICSTPGKHIITVETEDWLPIYTISFTVLDDGIPDCTHPTISEEWDLNYPAAYQSISLKEHYVTRYQYKYCTTCLKRIGESYPVTITENHETKKEEEETYAYYDEHEHVRGVFYKYVCKDCGEVVSKDDDGIYKPVFESHKFNSNGKCTKCDYVQYNLNISAFASQYQSGNNTVITATAKATDGSGAYTYFWEVKYEGSVISSSGPNDDNTFFTSVNIPGRYYIYVKVNDEKTEKNAYTIITIDVDNNTATAAPITEIPSATPTISVTNIPSSTPTSVSVPTGSPTSIEPVNSAETPCPSDRPQETIVPAEHKHVYIWDYEKVPTCTESGIKNYKCSVCGNSYMEETAAKGHIFNVKTLISEEYTSFDGKSHYLSSITEQLSCSVCGALGETITTNISKENHGLLENHNYVNHICSICGYKSEVTTAYRMTLQNVSYSYESLPCVRQNESHTILVEDLSDYYREFNLFDEQLYIEADNGCVVQGTYCTFNNWGIVNISLKSSITGETFDTMQVAVTALTVDDGFQGWHYKDEMTNVVQLADMEEVNWKKTSLYAAENVYFNDFEVKDNTVKFKAYNRGTLNYAIVSYDCAGKEIDRCYINGYDATTSMILGAIQTFSATARIFDSKAGNDQQTEQTIVSLNIESGGSIKVLQPDEDMDLFVTNWTEVFFRTLDYVEAHETALTFVNKNASKLAQAVGKEAVKQTVEEVFAETINETLVQDAKDEIMRTIMASKEWKDLTLHPEVFMEKVISGITDKADELGITVVESAIKTFEAAGMLALNGVTGGTTAVVETLLNSMQIVADAAELKSLTSDLNRCMNGERLVRLETILIPE